MNLKGESNKKDGFSVFLIRNAQKIVGGLAEKDGKQNDCRGGRLRLAKLPFCDRRLADPDCLRQLHLAQSLRCAQFLQPFLEFHRNIIDKSSLKILDKSEKTCYNQRKLSRGVKKY